MALTPTDIDLIRDEVGNDPTDSVLYAWGDELGHWLPVAIRVLKRRRADASAGGQETTSFALPGVISVGMTKADLRGLDTQIARLEAQWATLNGEDTTRAVVRVMRRPDRYR